VSESAREDNRNETLSAKAGRGVPGYIVTPLGNLFRGFLACFEAHALQIGASRRVSNEKTLACSYGISAVCKGHAATLEASAAF
jgi:hypothetical protein